MGLSNAPIWELADACPVRKQDVLLPVGKFNCFDAALLDALDCAVGENALLFTVSEDAFNCAVREVNFFGAIRVVLLNLVVCEAEHLHPVWQSRLSSLRLCEVINDSPIWVRLLFIPVVKANHRVAVGEYQAFHSVSESHLLLTAREDALSLAVFSNLLLYQSVPLNVVVL